MREYRHAISGVVFILITVTYGLTGGRGVENFFFMWLCWLSGYFKDIKD